MKSRSKALYQFLLEAGVLEGTEEEIKIAKEQYRKAYKAQWKKQRLGKKEIRFDITIREFSELKLRASQYALSPTAFSRQAVLCAARTAVLVPRKDELLRILQLLGMTTIGASSNTVPQWTLAEQLNEAEKILIEYLTHLNEPLWIEELKKPSH